jgi:uncharacterized protein YndB with AHSA1/START domain
MDLHRNISIKIKHLIYSSPEEVFDALTDSAKIKKWSGGKARVELKKSGAFEMFDGWVKGEVLEFEKAKHLSYTWKGAEWGKKAAPSVVAFKFIAHKAGTEISLEHSGFPNEEEAKKHYDGWINYVFDPLNDFFTS